MVRTYLINDDGDPIADGKVGVADLAAAAVATAAADVDSDISTHAAITTAHVASGTSFPGAPSTGDLYFRTDIRDGLEFMWNGTRWLSTTLFSSNSDSWWALTGGGPTTEGAYIPFNTGGLDVWLEDSVSVTYSSTGDGANYITFSLSKRAVNNANTAIGSWTTAADGVAWTSHVINVNAVLDVSATPAVRCHATVTLGNPLAYGSHILYYRLIAT